MNCKKYRIKLELNYGKDKIVYTPQRKIFGVWINIFGWGEYDSSFSDTEEGAIQRLDKHLGRDAVSIELKEQIAQKPYICVE